ncbi:tail fiber domain-containing protein [Agrobacterium vitis]
MRLFIITAVFVGSATVSQSQDALSPRDQNPDLNNVSSGKAASEDDIAETSSPHSFTNQGGLSHQSNSETPDLGRLPGWSANIQGTGVPGLDGKHWMLWNKPKAPDPTTTMRVDRHAAYSGGTSGNVTSAFWSNCSASASVVNFEWCGRFFMDNSAIGGQNLALNAVAQRYATSGPTWSTNFLCQQLDGVANPTASCIGSEYDIVGNGTDKNRQRIGLQMVVARPPSGGVDAHAYAAFWTTPERKAVWDNILVADGSGGTYGNGIDLSKGAFSGSALALGPSQKLAFDAMGGSTFNRYMFYAGGSLAYQTQNGVVAQLNDDGRIQAGRAGAVGPILSLQNSSGVCTHTPSSSAETISCISDERLKREIHDASSVSEWISTFRIRDFIWNATGEQRTGVIAQEVQKLHPEMVHAGDDGMLRVDEPSPWLLIKAVQEQQAQIARLQMWLLLLSLSLAAFTAFTILRRIGR